MFHPLLAWFRKSRPTPTQIRPQLVGLEDRAVPASFTVDSVSDVPVAGKLTLREAMTTANTNTEDDNIFLAEALGGTTLTLTGGELKSTEVGKGLEIGYSGTNPVTIDANKLSRIFTVAANAKLSVGRVNLINGKADKGGAIFNAGELSVSGTTIKNCEATADGGAIFTDTGSKLSVSSATISGNTTVGGGGGIFDFGAIGFTVSGSLIAGNSAGTIGGGIVCGNLNVANSTISENGADGDGGGVWFNGQLISVNNTFFGNAADNDGDAVGSGGALFVGTGGVGKLSNTLMVGNEKGKTGAAVANEIAGTLSVADSKFNLVGDSGSAGGLVHGTDGNIVGNAGAGTLDATTVLNKTLAENGNIGGVFSHALVTGSKALDAGSNALAVNPGSTTSLSNDGRGFPFVRIANTTVDIGALEHQNITPHIVVPTTKFTILEDDLVGVVFTGAGKTFSITDDVGTAPNFEVTLKATKSTITLGSTTGLTNLTGNGTELVSFKAPTLAILNAALDGTKYVAGANQHSLNGGGGIEITVNDNDATAPGGAKSTNGSVPVTITPVIDTPSVTNPVTAKDTPVEVVFTRSAVDGAEITHFKVSKIVGGTLTYSTSPLGPGTKTIVVNEATLMSGTFFLLTPDELSKLTFTPTAGFEGFATFDIQAGLGAYNADPQTPAFGGTIVTSKIAVGNVDTVAPTAALGTAPAVTDASKGTATYDFTVTFSDNVAVSFASIDGKDVRITGPNSFNQLATLVGVDKTGDGTPRTATYRITAPGGTWDSTDNGKYTIALEASQIADTVGNFAAANASLGSFTATLSPPVVVPNPVLVGFAQFAVGADRGGNGSVQFFNADKSPRLTDPLTPFGAIAGGVRVASGDVNGDGVADIVVGTGPGRATQVKVFDGKTLTELFSVDPFEAAFTGGVYVAVGDVNGDGKADLAITPDEGGGPRCRVFNGADFKQLNDFFGIEDTAFRGGARAAFGDVDGDGKADLIVVAGFGGGPRVAGFKGVSVVTGTPTPEKLFPDFLAFESALRNGIFVAVGDVNGDGKADIVAGGGPGGGPRVTVFHAVDLLNNVQTSLANFFAGDVNNRGGIRVAVRNLDGDTKADLVVGAGTGAGSRVTSYLGASITAAGTPTENFGFDAIAGFTGGVFVG